MMKEITVVMPVYKVEKYVSECLDSIINQTFDCFECIIIDDCSPDNSMRLIEEKLAGYKGNISFRIVRNERNEGADPYWVSTPFPLQCSLIGIVVRGMLFHIAKYVFRLRRGEIPCETAQNRQKNSIH